MADQHNSGSQRHGNKRTVQGIEVRKVPFEFPPNFRPHWHPDDPALSQLNQNT
jgi:hypothetical protein